MGKKKCQDTINHFIIFDLFPVFVFQPKNGKFGVYFSNAESIGDGKVLPVTLLS